MQMRVERCPNLNHVRMNPPVRFCPTCSKEVNARISIPMCSEEKHAKSRRERSTYCVDCGKQLIGGDFTRR